jgi:hypothetical protein
MQYWLLHLISAPGGPIFDPADPKAGLPATLILRHGFGKNSIHHEPQKVESQPAKQIVLFGI